jgi:hypothetical protein
MALRNLARLAATGDAIEDAALFLGASRRNMPSYGLDPSIYAPLEEQARDVLGADRFEALAAQGAALTHAQLLDLVGSRARGGPSSRRPSGSGAS